MKESSSTEDSSTTKCGETLTNEAFTMLMFAEALGKQLIAERKYTLYLGCLWGLCQPLNALFDEVKVNSDCEEKTALYQRLIKRALKMFDNYIDFSKLTRNYEEEHMKDLCALYDRLKGLQK